MGCPVPGSNLGSSIIDQTNCHNVNVCGAVHMSNAFSHVNKCQQGVNVSTVKYYLSDASHVRENAEFCGNTVNHATRCFYHSDLDKKEVRGLIAKGNNTKALGLVKDDKVFKSRTFVTSRPFCVSQNDQESVNMATSLCTESIVTMTLFSQPIRWGTQKKLPCCVSKMRFIHHVQRQAYLTCPQPSILSTTTQSFPVYQLDLVLCWFCSEMVLTLPPG